EQQIMQELKCLTQINHDQNTTNNIIDVYAYFILSEEQLCSSVQRMQIILEYLQRDLQVEIKTKKLQNQRFQVQEIYIIAFSCINALSNLQKFNLAYGDLNTFNILVSEFFEVKLLHPSINKIIPSYLKMISQTDFQTKGVYLSPLLVNAVFNKNYHPVHNPFKSDVFTLGVILIECCFLNFCDELYCYENGEFNLGVLNDYLLKIKAIYGNEVFSLIQRMTVYEENQREDFIQLAQAFNVQNFMNQIHIQIQLMMDQNRGLNINGGYQLQIQQQQQGRLGVSLYKNGQEEDESEIDEEKNSFLNENYKEQYTFQNLDQNQISTENQLYNRDKKFQNSNKLLSQNDKINTNQIKHCNIKNNQNICNNINNTNSSNYNNYENTHEIYDDNSYYIGEKLDGLRHGIGKFYYADGGYYEGVWVKGRMEGMGTLYYPSGALAYMGQWKNDQFNGNGTVYNEQPAQIDGDFDISNFDNLGEFWDKYEGDFIDDNKEGQGVIYLSNGDRFQGNFQNDFVHGQGTFYKGNQ
ncbi:protein kinase domain protein, partial [Ichthyophthirius multifiliis]